MRLDHLHEGDLRPKPKIPDPKFCGGCRAADEEGPHAKCGWHGLARHEVDKAIEREAHLKDNPQPGGI